MARLAAYLIRSLCSIPVQSDIRAAFICCCSRVVRSGDRAGGTPKIVAGFGRRPLAQILWKFDGYGPSHGSA
jgi:hypothetical protein